MCCAFIEIEEIDSSKTGHSSYITALKDAGMPTTEGAKSYYCEDDYPTAFGPAFMDSKTLETPDTSVWNKAGIEFKAYCDGHASSLIVGSITSVAAIVMMY